MKTLKFFLDWDDPVYDKEITETTHGLSTELDAQALTSIDYNKFEARRLQCTFFDDGWFEASVKRGDVIVDNDGSKTVYSNYKCRLFDGDSVLFTGYVDLENSPKSRKSGIVQMTAKSPVALLQNGITDSDVRYQLRTMKNPIPISQIFSRVMSTAIRQSGMQGDSTYGFIDRYNTNIDYVVPYDIDNLTVLDVFAPESITIKQDLQLGYGGYYDTIDDYNGYPAGTVVEPVINSYGFRLDTDGVIRFYYSYIQPVQIISQQAPQAPKNSFVIFPNTYIVVDMLGLTSLISYNYTGEGFPETADYYEPEFIEREIETSSGFTTMFPTLSESTYTGDGFQFIFADESLIVDGEIPTESVILNQDRITTITTTNELTLPWGNTIETETESSYADFSCTELFELCRLLLLIKVYADEMGIIQVTNIPDETEVEITDASGTEDIGILHSKIDTSDLLSMLQLDSVKPISKAINKKFADAYATPAIKTKTFNSNVKVDRKAIIGDRTYLISKVKPDKYQIVFEIEGWEYE